MEGILLQLVRLAAAVVFAALAQYLAIRVFDQFTSRIDEVAELKKGNYAVGIVLGSVILSVATVIAGGVAGLVPDSLSVSQIDFWAHLGSGVLNLVLSLVLSVGAIFVGMSVFDHMVTEIDVQAELKKRNLGVAVLLAAVIYASAIVVQAGLPRF